MSSIAEVLKKENTVVVDVRTPGEFMGGHVAGSINIPLNEIPGRMNEIKNLRESEGQAKNIVLCCASGGRSMNAAVFLKQNGIECFNGGPWTDVNYFLNNN